MDEDADRRIYRVEEAVKLLEAAARRDTLDVDKLDRTLDKIDGRVSKNEERINRIIGGLMFASFMAGGGFGISIYAVVHSGH